jgi:hypothetical protein
LGGGYGSPTHLGVGGNGGSGGGGSGWSDTAGGTGQQPASASGGFGNNGGAAMSGTSGGASGGGGGAGAVGTKGATNKGGNGGVGLDYSQFASVGGSPAGWFGGGGGGGVVSGGTIGSGGSGGGGNGNGIAGTANTGGGGGGNVSTGGAGGSGIVIIRYLTSGASSGTIMSPEIDFDWVTGQSSWGTAAFSTTETNGNITLKAYYTVSAACDTIVPDIILSGNSSGFDVSASPINISGLIPVASTYNKICLLATLTYSGGTPLLNDWTVTWSAASADSEILIFE